MNKTKTGKRRASKATQKKRKHDPQAGKANAMQADIEHQRRMDSIAEI